MIGIFARMRGILLRPQTEWPVIARERTSLLALSIYVAILALIPVLARFVGGSLIGGHRSYLAGLMEAGVAYGLAIATVLCVALVVDLLAPTFGGERSFAGAIRLTAYSFTPVWLAGIFLLVPGASFLSLLGLYGAYLMWLGLPILMLAPQERALAYAAAVAACALVLDIAARYALAAVSGAIR